MSVVVALCLAGGGASAALAAPPAANALPRGGVVVAGSARIDAPGANQLQVNQSSQQAVINWNSFDIGAQAKVNFAQPDASASVLNRVLANDPTRIFGQLSANGQVYIVNPNGIVFGAGSRVDAGALVASTLNIADSDFMRGQARFTRDGATGSVSNEGSLNAAPAGYVALLGARVNNKGSISAPGGSAILAAGDAVQLPITGSGLVTLALSPASVNAAVSNGAEGVISAPGGQVYLSAAAASGLAAQVLNEGQIAARDGVRVTLSAIQADGLGETRQQGLIDVASDTGMGGNVALLGDRVGLFAGSQVLASGAQGGGAVLVGGDSEGHGSACQAHAVYVDPQARIDASATQAGNGGSVSLWSLDYTGFYGQITARGGAQGGNGGLVETSSHDNLQAFGRVDAAAPHGTAGSWLLDPTDVTIVTGAVNSNDIDAGGVWTPTTNTAQIAVANINADLDAGTSVTIQTTSAGGGVGNIVQNAGANIAKTAGGNATLTMSAAGGITLNGNISSTAGTLATTLNANGGAVGGSGTINLNGGQLTVNAASGGGTLTGSLSGTGGLRKFGNGTLQLSGAGFNYTGATLVNAGQLLLNASTAYQSPTTVLSGARLSFTSNANLSIPAAATISLNNGATLENLNPANYTVLAGAVTSSGTTTINQNSNSTGVAGEGLFLDGTLKGAGTVTINAPNAGSAVVLRSNAANTFSGNIIVNGIASATPFAGSGLAVSSTAGFASPASFTVNGTLEMGNQGIGWGNSPVQVALNSLSGSGVVVGNFSAAGAAFGLQIGSTGGSGNFSGTIADGNNRQLKLTKSGIGTQILTGANTYTGTTTINGTGTLQVGNGGTTGTLGSGAVTDNANLVFNRSDALAVPNTISGIGNLTATSGDNLTLNGAVNLGGTVLLTAGAGQPVAAPAVANGSVTGGDVTLNAAVTAGGAGKLTIYSGNATTAAYEAEIAGSATSLNKAYATAPGAGTVDASKTLNVFYRVSPSATVNATANDKIYDSTTGATVNAGATSATGGIDGDTLSGSVGSASFADPNAGNGKSVGFTGASVTSNNPGQTVNGYRVAAPASTANITPAALTLTATSNSKTYDASTGAAAAPTVSGLQGGDSVTGLSEAYADKNAGTGKTLVVGNGYAVNDGNGGGNYAVSLVNSTAGMITPATLTLTAATNSKTYDGTVGAAPIPSAGGLQGGDSVMGLSEAYADPNAGAGKTLVVNGYTVNDGNGGANYTVNLVNNGTGSITPASLTVQANNDAKFVTQTDASGYAGLSYIGFVNGETAAVLGGSAGIARSNAGTQGAGAYAGVLQASGLTSNNYTIRYAAGNYTIVPANELLVRLGNNSATYGSAASYGAPTAQYMLSDGSIVTLAPNINGNQVTVNDGIGGGVDFSVQVNGSATSTSGNLRAGGYQLGAAGVSGNSANFSNNLVVTGALSVNPLAVTVAAGGISKTYDSNASVTGLTLGLTGELAGDVVTASGSGGYASKNAGTGLGYTVSNLALTGPDGSNYVISGGTNTYSGNNGTITPAVLTLTAASNSKTYDAGTGAAAAPTVSGLQGGDSVTGLSEAYADKNAGTGKTLVVGHGYAVSDGNGGGNYAVSLVDSTAGTITPAALTLTAASNSKTYDASTGAAAAPTVSGLQGSDSVTGLSEAYADKNAGTGKTLVVGGGYAINDGNGGANYTVSLVNGTAGTITPRPVTVAAPDWVIKTYDGSTVVPAGYSPVVVRGGIGEGVQGGTLSYATPDIGTGKIVVVSNVVMDDGNGGHNYVVTQQPSDTGIVLSNVQAISRLERVWPEAPADLTLWMESCAEGCAIQLSDIRAQLPEICGITAVAGPGMAAMPAGIDYEPASGRLRFAPRVSAPQTIMARTLDCSGRQRDVRIRLIASVAGQGHGVGLSETSR